MITPNICQIDLPRKAISFLTQTRTPYQPVRAETRSTNTRDKVNDFLILSSPSLGSITPVLSDSRILHYDFRLLSLPPNRKVDIKRKIVFRKEEFEAD